ncbi:MAG: hypothetical protein QME96_00995 [Myxococcota bacterium]|nr:hypothetical protein [Myxococcota bacterium]
MACGSESPGAREPAPAPEPVGAAQRQLALVPANVQSVAQADVRRFYDRAAAREVERLLGMAAAAEMPGGDVGCLFDLLKTVGQATAFVWDPPGGSDQAAVLLETDAEPAAVGECIERATAGTLCRVPTRADWADAVAIDDCGAARGDEPEGVIFVMEEGLLAIAEWRLGQAMRSRRTGRPIASDPAFRALSERAGPGDATLVVLQREPARDRGRPVRWSGFAGSVRAGPPVSARAVFVSRDGTDIASVVRLFEHARGEMIRQIRSMLDVAGLPIEVDRERTGAAMDAVSGILESVSARGAGDTVTFEVVLPDSTNAPSLAADLAYLLAALLLR